MSWGDESAGGHLLCVKTPSDGSWGVLTLWNGSRNGLRFEVVIETSLILVRYQQSSYLNRCSLIAIRIREGLTNLVWIILPDRERGDLPVLLGFSPVEDVLVVVCFCNLAHLAICSSNIYGCTEISVSNNYLPCSSVWVMGNGNWGNDTEMKCRGESARRQKLIYLPLLPLS